MRDGAAIHCNSTPEEILDRRSRLRLFHDDISGKFIGEAPRLSP